MAVGEQTEKLDVSAGLKSSQEKASVFLANSESFFFFCLCLCFLGEALNRRSLFLIFQSQFSLLTAPLSLSSQLFLPLCLVFFIYILVKSLSALCAPTLTFISFFPPQSLYSRQTGRNTLDKDIRFPLDPTVKSVLEPIRGVLTYSMRSHLSHSLYCELHREREFIMTDPCCVFAGIRRSHVNKTEKSSTVSHRHEKEALLPA